MLVLPLLALLAQAGGPTVSLQGLEQFQVGQWMPGDGDIFIQQNVCVYASPNGRYLVSGYSEYQRGTNFRMSDGGSAGVAYDLAWSEGRSTLPTRRDFLKAGRALIRRDGDPADPTCGGGATSTITLQISATGGQGLNAAPGGVYRDQLTLLIEPQ